MEIINTLLSCEHAHTQAQDRSILLEENLRKGLEYFPEVLKDFEFPDLTISLICENPKEHHLDGRTPKFGLAVYCGSERICTDWIPPVRADADLFLWDRNPWCLLWEKVVAAYLEGGNPFPRSWEPLIAYEWNPSRGAVPVFVGEVEEEVICLAHKHGSCPNVITHPKDFVGQARMIKSVKFRDLTLLKLSPGVVVKTKEQVRREIREEEARINKENVAKAQAFVGWTVSSVTIEGVEIKSPTGETAMIYHDTQMFFDGESGQSGLTIGDIYL